MITNDCQLVQLSIAGNLFSGTAALDRDGRLTFAPSVQFPAGQYAAVLDGEAINVRVDRRRYDSARRPMYDAVIVRS